MEKYKALCLAQYMLKDLANVMFHHIDPISIFPLPELEPLRGVPHEEQSCRIPSEKASCLN